MTDTNPKTANPELLIELVEDGWPSIPIELYETGKACARELIAIREELETLQNSINEHNDSCAQSCKWSQENGRCEGYIIRNKQCPDCPRDWIIGDAP